MTTNQHVLRTALNERLWVPTQDLESSEKKLTLRWV